MVKAKQGKKKTTQNLNQKRLKKSGKYNEIKLMLNKFHLNGFELN